MYKIIDKYKQPLLKVIFEGFYHCMSYTSRHLRTIGMAKKKDPDKYTRFYNMLRTIW